jgi:hypothetical protein
VLVHPLRVMRAGDAGANHERVTDVEIVAVVGSTTEAELIVGLLRSHGVRAAVATDDAGGQYPQLQMDGVRVLVASADEAAARQLLTAADDTGGRDSS